MRGWTGLWRAACAAIAVIAAASAVRAAGYTVETATIAVNGTSARVLTDAQGMTLYYAQSDTPAMSSCTGGCAKIWTPLLSATAPTAEDPLPGRLAAVKTANGPQVSYNGHFLYTYAGDSAPHQAYGQGVAGKWWVATVDLKPAPAAPPTTNDHNGGY